MPIVVSVEGKDDSTRFSDFLFIEKCLGKSQGKDVMKADVRNTEGEKEVRESFSYSVRDHSDAFL